MDRTFGKIFRILFILPKVLSNFAVFKLDVG